MTRALAMVSGGLDSILAAKLIKEQGIEVIGICFRSYFFNEKSAIKMTEQIGIKLEVIDFSQEQFDLVRNPKHGWGKNMNPCIDCHTLMMKYSGELLEKFNADFIITGEVLNQRPMSQNKQALNIVKKESGYASKILRPLCALNLDPTEMELNGLVDREKLLKISGRSRKPQMELAEKWGIKEYPSPAGGCKLTDPNYSIRLRDALNRKENLTQADVDILRYGRHFILPNGSKLIITRTAEEGKDIKTCLSKEDIIFLPSIHNGAMGVIHGENSKEDLELACSLVARYSKGRDEDQVPVKFGVYGTPFNEELSVKPATEEMVNEYLL